MGHTRKLKADLTSPRDTPKFGNFQKRLSGFLRPFFGASSAKAANMHFRVEAERSGTARWKESIRDLPVYRVNRPKHSISISTILLTPLAPPHHVFRLLAELAYHIGWVEIDGL